MPWSFGPLTSQGSALGELGRWLCSMRSGKLTLWLLPALAFGCAQFQPGEAPGPDVLVSFPNRMRQGDQVVGFELHIRNGTILALDKVPHDWVIRMLAAGPGSEISGEPNHGASAFLDMTPLKRFVTVHKDRDPLELVGSVVVTTEFTIMRTNFVRTEDFLLEAAAPNQPVQRRGASRFAQREMRTSLAAGSRR
jgi:hypothetical protein